MKQRTKGYFYTGIGLVAIGVVLAVASLIMDGIVVALEATGMTVIAPFTGLVFWVGIIIIVCGALYSALGMVSESKRRRWRV